MLTDAAPVLLVSTADTITGLPEPAMPVLVLDDPATAAAIAAEPPQPPAAGLPGSLRPEHPAYVIYTSGSTGKPKGVVVPHAGIAALAASQAAGLGAGPGGRVLQFAALSFDAAAWEVIMAVTTGGCLVLAGAEDLRPGRPLADLMASQRISHATVPPSALAALPHDTELPDLATLVVGRRGLPARAGRALVRPDHHDQRLRADRDHRVRHDERPAGGAGHAAHRPGHRGRAGLPARPLPPAGAARRARRAVPHRRGAGPRLPRAARR